MNENEFPDNKKILKRVAIVIALIAVAASLIFAKDYLSIVIWFLATVLSIFIIILFIRLCFDVHSIAKHIEKSNNNEQ